LDLWREEGALRRETEVNTELRPASWPRAKTTSY
jgi:hypothetical protein